MQQQQQQATNASRSALPRLLSSALYRQGSNPLMKKLARSCFGGDIEAAKDFAGKCLSLTTTIETHQKKFSSLFVEYRRKMHGAGERVSPQPSRGHCEQRERGHIVHFVSEDSGERGFWTFPYEMALLWLLDFYVGDSFRERSYQMLVDIPYSFTWFVFARAERGRYAGMVRYVCDVMLSEDSHDRSLWNDPESSSIDALTAAGVLYYDKFMTMLTEDVLGNGALEARTDMASEGRSDEEHIRADADERLHRVLMAGYIYAFYCLHQSPSLHAIAKITKRFAPNEASPIGGSVVSHLFPIVVSMFNADEITPYQPALLDLYEEDDGQVMGVLAFVAERMREFVRSDCVRCSDPLLPRLYLRTSDLRSAVATHTDTRHRILVEQKHTRNTRWLYMGAHEVPFTRFVHDLNEDLQGTEQERVSMWLRDEASHLFRVELADVMRAQSLDAAVRSSSQPEVVADIARRLERHFAECDEALAVLRFSPEVRSYEVSMTFEYLAQLYPHRLHAKRWADPGRNGTEWRSCAFLVGADCRGPYVVVVRRYLEIVRQTMLTVALQSFRFHKNMPVFPILSRFYFMRATRSSDPIDRQRRNRQRGKPEQAGFFEETVPMPLDGESIVACERNPPSETGSAPESPPSRSIDVVPVDADDHALHCTVQTIARWLGLPTEHSSLIESPASSSSSSSASSKRRRTPHSSSSADCDRYVPRMEDDFFPCMRFLHRLADQLSRACASRSVEFLGESHGLACLSAIRDFVEIKRPRSVRRDVMERVLEALERSPRLSENRAHEDWARTIRVLLASAPTVSSVVRAAKRRSASPESGEVPPVEDESSAAAAAAAEAVRGQKEPGADSDWIDLSSIDCESFSDGDLFSKASLPDADTRTSMANWLLYVPCLNDVLPPEIVYDLLIGGGGGKEGSIRVEGRERLTAQSFAKPLYCGYADMPPIIGEYLSRYSQCFVVPYTHNRRTLSDEFAENREPMQAFVEIVRHLEEKVSSKRVAELMRTNMASFDLDAFVSERTPQQARIESSDLASTAGFLRNLSPDGRSMLPVQGRTSASGNDVDFVFYDSSLAVVSFVGTEYARALLAVGSSASAKKKEARAHCAPKFPTTTTTKQQKCRQRAHRGDDEDGYELAEPLFANSPDDCSVGRLIDIVGQFRSTISLERVTRPDSSMRSMRQFVRMVREMPRPGPLNGKVDRSRVFTSTFRRFEEVRKFVVETRRQAEIDSMAKRTPKQEERRDSFPFALMPTLTERDRAERKMQFQQVKLFIERTIEHQNELLRRRRSAEAPRSLVAKKFSVRSSKKQHQEQQKQQQREESPPPEDPFDERTLEEYMMECAGFVANMRQSLPPRISSGGASSS